MINGDYKLLVLDESEMLTKFVKKPASHLNVNKVASDLILLFNLRKQLLASHVYSIPFTV